MRRTRARSGSASGVVARRCLHQTGEHRRLRQGEVDGVDAEIALGGGLDPVGALAVVHEVQVAGEDLGLRVLLLQGQCEPGFPQLAADAGLGGLQALRGRGRRLEQGLLHQLLGDRGPALHHLAGDHVAHQGPCGALDVHAVVLVEPRVLDVDQRLLHDRGDLVGGDGGAVVPVEPGDQRSVRGQDGGVARGGLVTEDPRQRREQVRRRPRDESRPDHPRHQHARDQGPGQRDGEEEQDRESVQARVGVLVHRPPRPLRSRRPLAAGDGPARRCSSSGRRDFRG